jgi:hypothetical protein
VIYLGAAFLGCIGKWNQLAYGRRRHMRAA